MKLENKVAIITGGAMGIGRGIVNVFLRQGAIVYIFDYSDKIDEAIEKLKNQGYENKIFGFKLDIRNKDEIENAVNEIINKHGRIDVLVNNAGVAKIVSFMDMSDEIRDYHFDINIKGAWNVSKVVVPHMIEQRSGAIVNTSSVTGNFVADPGEVAYATTKAAMTGFTKGLAAELAKYGIRVNAILPGYIMTPMVSGIAKDSDESNPKAVIDGIANAIPLGRLGYPEEAGDLAAFLASDEASYLTGQEYVIDGGSTLPETTTVG